MANLNFDTLMVLVAQGDVEGENILEQISELRCTIESCWDDDVRRAAIMAILALVKDIEESIEVREHRARLEAAMADQAMRLQVTMEANKEQS